MSASGPGVEPPDLPGYRFLRPLGSGGYSQVYLYEQGMPERKVAIKVLKARGLTQTVRRQFTAEANAMAGLADHPNIVQVFHADIAADGRPYLVMQYYPQPDLSVRARREHFSVADVLRIGIQIGSAVETAHRNGILHRDIKPHNILTGQFGPVLTDFGIATTKGAADDGPEGMSVPWSPPEVLNGTSDGDERSDVYSLAATLWHLFTGRSPFEEPGGENGGPALMRRIQSDPPPRVQGREVPESLQRLLRQAMAKDPAARPQTALDLVRGLQAVEQEQRLPLTQIVTAPEAPAETGSPSGGDDEQTLVRAPRRIDPHAPRTDRPPSMPARTGALGEVAETAATRVRGPVRIDLQPQAAPVTPSAARSARQRQMPGEAPGVATTARPPAGPAPVAADGSKAGVTRVPARSRRLIGVTVCGLLAAIAIAAVVFPQHDHSPAFQRGRSGGGGQNALGPGTSAPGIPAVVAVRAGANRLRFRWTYVNHASGDVFRWHWLGRGAGPRAGTTTAPTLVLTVHRGQIVCVTVQVVRADGSQESTPSSPVCES